MKNLRLGKDITIKWKVQPVDGDLSLFIVDSRANRIKLDYWIEEESIVSRYYGKEQKYYGTYSVELWMNYGKENQSVIDRKYCFKLVCNSSDESDTVELEDDYFSVGIQGDSAYKAWLNVGNTGTEEDFIAWLADNASKNEIQEKLKEVDELVNDAVSKLILNIETGTNNYNNF